MSKNETLKNLYLELEKVKAEAQERYNQTSIAIDQADIEKRLALSRHLLDFADFRIDRKWLERLFDEYVSTLRRFEGSKEVANELDQGFKRDELDPQILVKKVFCADLDYLKALSRKLNLKVEDLVHLGLRLGTPVFELHAEKLKGKFDPATWSKGYCPICGSPPAMAYLRHDDGKRILWCQFCGTEWSFLRLKCPYCYNDKQETLRYFFTEEKEAYRVYVCDKCKKYVKTIDQRKLSDYESMDLAWENLESLALDVLAQQDGYSTPPARAEV